MKEAGDGFMWSVDPNLDLCPLIGECAITISRSGMEFELRSKKRISEVIEACRKRFGASA